MGLQLLLLLPLINGKNNEVDGDDEQEEVGW